MKTYTIAEGNNYPINKLTWPGNMHSGVNSMSINVLYTPSCYFNWPKDPDGSDPDKDWNKAGGFSCDLLDRNSIRNGWRPYSVKKIEASLYLHLNGKIYTVPGVNRILGKFYMSDLEEECVKYTIDLMPDRTIIYSGFQTMNTGEKVFGTLIHPFDKTYGAGYYQNIYIGGNKPAQHDMILKMDYKGIIR